MSSVLASLPLQRSRLAPSPLDWPPTRDVAQAPTGGRGGAAGLGPSCGVKRGSEAEKVPRVVNDFNAANKEWLHFAGPRSSILCAASVEVLRCKTFGITTYCSHKLLNHESILNLRSPAKRTALLA